MANAWVGHFSVQAVDTSILAIAITVLMIVRQSNLINNMSGRSMFAVCVVSWIPSLTTGKQSVDSGFEDTDV
jgi:hypothetical protein